MRPDPSTLIGLILAVAGLGLGIVLEGGSIAEILQPTAALIVFGGTAGATLLAQPFGLAVRSLKRAAGLFIEPPRDPAADIDTLADLSAQSRRAGILSVESQVDALADPFLRQALRMGIDGVEAHEIRAVMELRIEQDLERREAEARVLESAGGFAPTIGILGAVLGLIQVMKNLDDMAHVGEGIAVAFVATIYGVGIANLALLPAAKKISTRAGIEANHRAMLVDGVLKLIEGRNPRVLRSRMETYLDQPPRPAAENEAAAARRAASAEGA